MFNPFGSTTGLSSLFNDVVDWFNDDDEDETRKQQAEPPTPTVDHQSLFNEEPEMDTVVGSSLNGARKVVRNPTLVEDASDPRFPAFQKAWREGKPVEDLLGDDPFSLKARIAGNGGDNWRPDVAKVQVLLNKAGYHDIIPEDGPNGYHSAALDRDIRNFQRANKLIVDGKLSPGGETIRTLERTLSAKPKVLAQEDMPEPLPSDIAGVTQPRPSTTIATPRPNAPPPVKRPPGKREFKAPDWESEAIFERLVEPIFKAEGGYSNDTIDRGGETNYGITKGILEKYQLIHGNMGTGGSTITPKEITKQQAMEIYRNEFFYGQRLNEIKNPTIASAILDASVIHGPSNAWKFMQESINSIDNSNTLTKDGIGGTVTINRINSLPHADVRRLIEKNDAVRRGYMANIIASRPDQKRFSRGWGNRLDELKRRLLDNENRDQVS